GAGGARLHRTSVATRPFSGGSPGVLNFAYHDGQQAPFSEEDLAHDWGDGTRLVLPIDREELRETHHPVEETDPLALSSEAHGDSELAQGRERHGSGACERARRPHARGGRQIGGSQRSRSVSFDDLGDSTSNAGRTAISRPSVCRCKTP